MASTDDLPKLTYFDIRGLAELPRLLLAAGNVKYIDDRLPFVNGASTEEWHKLKPNAPYGQVPIFTYDGVQIPQSSTIVRFISKLYHLDGDSDIDTALIDAGYEHVLDTRKSYFLAKGDAAKVEEYWSKKFPDQIALLEKNIVGSASAPFFRGGRMQYVDIAIYYLLWVLNTENAAAVSNALTAHPKVAALYKAVETDERIAAYVAARKVTPM